MRLAFAAVLLLAVPAFAAAPTLEEAGPQAGALSHRAAALRPGSRGVPALPRLGEPGRRGVATISGVANGSGFEFSLNRATGEASGSAHSAPIALRIDDRAGFISGVANGYPVNLRHEDGMEQLFGRANGLEVGYVVLSGLLKGTLNSAPLELFVDRWGDIQGVAAGRRVQLRYEERTGLLTGSANGGEVRLLFRGLALDEFLGKYLFLLFGR